MKSEEILMFGIAIFIVIYFFPFFLLLCIPISIIYTYSKWEDKQSFNRKKDFLG